MLSGHPNIKRVYIKESYSTEKVAERTLFVETNLVNPDTGNKVHYKEWKSLYKYLEHLAQNDFVDFRRVHLIGD